jgi:hypothetical protein
MALGKVTTEKKYNLNDRFDRATIAEFEAKIEECEKREILFFPRTTFERKLSGFNLYLFENNLLIYKGKHKMGAVVLDNLEAYHRALELNHSLKLLKDRRAYRENENRK